MFHRLHEWMVDGHIINVHSRNTCRSKNSYTFISSTQDPSSNCLDLKTFFLCATTTTHKKADSSGVASLSLMPGHHLFPMQLT